MAVLLMYWKMKGGKLIKISDMTVRHLNNTIRYLKKQIDGSAHDDFCWDYINAMENELANRRTNNGENHKR